MVSLARAERKAARFVKDLDIDDLRDQLDSLRDYVRALSQSAGRNASRQVGRARNVAEAILWHGGEAEISLDAFRNMPKAEREALVKFVEAI